ncbi:TlpA disulfide reductase family protein [Pedobacter gandavensis]|uniref:TlpA family protein disulfide reductase n=1 Tax=Pedobacter gandavensis TaxID=2679963 RepID=UPI00292EE21B|nr:TlpA disulfide reductase family protein [Pedobacter gandavensis]
MNIRKLAIAALLAFPLGSSFAQLPVQVTGLMKKQTISPVKLFKVIEGRSVEIASATPGNTGKFGFIFYPEYEGLYVIGTGIAGSPSGNYKFYFKGGEQLGLSLLDSTYVLTGKQNSKENLLLTQWHEVLKPVEIKSVTFMSSFVDFFPTLEEVAEKSKTFMVGKTSGNVNFDRQMKSFMELDLAMFATNFLQTPRGAHPSSEEFSPYFDEMKALRFSKYTGNIYRYPWGQRTLLGMINANMNQGKIKYVRGMEGVKTLISFVANDTLKADVILDAASKIKVYKDYKELNDTYQKYVVTKSQKVKNMDILSGLAQLNPGDMAYNFSYPDNKGKVISLGDLKGKVVLIDVWATWCGPCKAEIPYLKKLEEEFKGTDLSVVSVSFDELEDKEKWIQMIKDEKLGGTHLFAGGWADFAQYYKIRGIPRFMVYDREGKIVTVDAPRPSNPALKALLEKTLAK